jgi:hypothetical protein
MSEEAVSSVETNYEFVPADEQLLSSLPIHQQMLSACKSSGFNKLS